jgi:hypothetical protein
MFESCRAHYPSKSGRFAAMTTCSGSAARSEVGERRRAKPGCAAGLPERRFDNCCYVLWGFEVRVMADFV